MLICIPTSVLGKEAPWSKMTKRRAGVGAGPSRVHVPGNPGGRLPKEGTAPARQQSTTAWKGPSAGETFGKSRPRACPGGLLGSGPEEQNVPFTKGCAEWGGARISSASGEPGGGRGGRGRAAGRVLGGEVGHSDHSTPQRVTQGLRAHFSPWGFI